MDKENENILELGILLAGKVRVLALEEILDVSSDCCGNMVIIFSFEHVLEFVFEECPERSQNLLYKDVCFNSLWILSGLDRCGLL